MAGKIAPDSKLIDVSKLISAYYTDVPDPAIEGQRVMFGTSGHRGTSLDVSFNEWHILAITQAICLYRTKQKINGPLFLGMDTHALSEPALVSALEVLAANGVEVMMAKEHNYTPTPAISHAILRYNRGRHTGLADGIVITPSHNPPRDGGFKYNSIHGGPIDTKTSHWIQNKANALLDTKLKQVKKMPYHQALQAASTHYYDYLYTYVKDLENILDMQLIRESKIHIGVDPMGGAGVHYWDCIAQHYGLNLTVVNETVDSTFRFMTMDWDGQIRMDPTSPYVMQKLITLKDRFDIAFACDTDHDRHGIVTPSVGLMSANHYLSVAIAYLFQHRPQWPASLAIGKTVVTTHMIDKIAKKLGRAVYDVPVGFKWFVEGLYNSSLAFVGEESGGGSFLRRNGGVWTTDKDGVVLALLAAEMTAQKGRNPSEMYDNLEHELGHFFYERIDVTATVEQKKMLSTLSPEQVQHTELAGDSITNMLVNAPGNHEAIGGLKVMTDYGWFAARPSGTENLYKIYAQSIRSLDHLSAILEQAQTIVQTALKQTKK